MSRFCIVCNRGPQTFYALSHSHHRTKKRWSVNLQKKRILFRGKALKGYVCTSCLGAPGVTLGK